VFACRAALAEGLRAAAPNTTLDANGYVADPAQNLIEGVYLADVEADLRQGSGNELAGKFRAAPSSSALAVNCFAPYKTTSETLPLSSGVHSTSYVVTPEQPSLASSVEPASPTCSSGIGDHATEWYQSARMTAGDPKCAF
jgi:hypothetical protein